MNNYKYEFQQQKFTTEVKKITGFETKKQRIPKDDVRYGKNNHTGFMFCLIKMKEHR